jgi:multimeric flavodoxin WrbA
MYAIAINGSPRQGGNTETLLKSVLQPLDAAGWKTELVQLHGKGPIQGCTACHSCFETQDGTCIIDDDIFNGVMAKMLEADAIILGSPTYFSDVSAEMKALIDRAGFVAFANKRLFAGKIGAAVVAVRRGGGIHVFDTINHFFLMSQMIVPGSVYWNLGYGLEPGEVTKDDEGLNNMKNLGETIHWLGTAMAPHKKTYPRDTGDEG